MSDQSTPISIPLTKGYSTIIDVVDGDLVDFKWYVHKAHKSHYAERWSSKDNTSLKLHRVILSRMLGRDLASREFVDHINGNGLDNRRCNLRLATNAENMRNERLMQTNTSGFKGVSYFKQHQKWRAYITLNGKKRHLGCFDTPELAHAAYCKAARELFGEFARFE